MSVASFTSRMFVGAVALLAVAGCDLPVDPGSDRSSDAEPARLGPEIDTGADLSARSGSDISGEFDLTARVTSDFSDQTVALEMRAVPDQSGEIASGNAAVSMELRRPDAVDEPGAATDEAAPVDASGTFRVNVTGFEIPADASEMLEEDTTADVGLDSQIIDSDCFRGDATVTMRDVKISGSTIPELELQGPFEAHRLDASCPGGGPSDAGIDAGVDTNGGN